MLSLIATSSGRRNFLVVVVAPLVAPLTELRRKFKSLIQRQGALRSSRDNNAIQGDGGPEQKEEEGPLTWSRSLVLFSSPDAQERMTDASSPLRVLFTTVHSLPKFDHLLQDANCVVMDEIATSASLVFGGPTLDAAPGQRFRVLSSMLKALRLAPHLFAMDRDVTLVVQLFLALKPYLIKHNAATIPPIRFVWYKLLDQRRITYELWHQKPLELDIARLIRDERKVVFWAQMSKRQANATDAYLRSALGVQEDDEWTVRTLTGDSETSAKEAMYRDPDRLLREHPIRVINATPTFGLGSSINEPLVDGICCCVVRCALCCNTRS